MKNVLLKKGKKNTHKYGRTRPKPIYKKPKKWYLGNLYLLIKNSKNILDKHLLYQWNCSLWINLKLANLSAHALSSRLHEKCDKS